MTIGDAHIMSNPAGDAPARIPLYSPPTGRRILPLRGIPARQKQQCTEKE